MAYVLLLPLLQIIHIRVFNSFWEVTHILLQGLIHQLKTAKGKFQVMIRRRDLEPLVDAPGWVNDEVRKGFMEGLDRIVDVLLKDEE